MGTVNVDTQKSERTLNAKYPLSSKEGVELLLEDVTNIQEGRYYKGDLAASDLLMDLELAIKKSGMTEVQEQAIRLLYFKDLTMEDAAVIAGCQAPAIYKRKEKAIEKLSAIFEKWGYDDEL